MEKTVWEWQWLPFLVGVDRHCSRLSAGNGTAKHRRHSGLVLVHGTKDIDSVPRCKRPGPRRTIRAPVGKL